MLRSIDPIMTDSKKVTAGILLIGDELLSGRTQDTNLAVIAKFLEPLGVQVGEARILSDEADIISGAVKEFSERFDYVFTCLLYTSPSPRDATLSRMPSSA